MTQDACTKSIDTYKDYSYIMYVLCNKTSSYYSTLKNTVNVPIIICSTALSILNSSDVNSSLDTIEKQKVVKYIGISFNLLIAVSIAILNVYKITEKEFFFNSQAASFLKINNKIQIEIAKNKNTLKKVDIVNIIGEYNFLCEKTMFQIPEYITKNVFKTYVNYELPVLLMENRKEKNRNTSIISYYTKKMPVFDFGKTDRSPLTPNMSGKLSMHLKCHKSNNSDDYDESSFYSDNENVIIDTNAYTHIRSPIQSVFSQACDNILNEDVLHHSKSKSEHRHNKSSLLNEDYYSNNNILQDKLHLSQAFEKEYENNHNIFRAGKKTSVYIPQSPQSNQSESPKSSRFQHISFPHQKTLSNYKANTSPITALNRHPLKAFKIQKNIAIVLDA